MLIRYNIAKKNEFGDYVLAGTNQGRFFKDTRAEAELMLEQTRANNSPETAAQFFGEDPIVGAFLCYDNGDACRHSVLSLEEEAQGPTGALAQPYIDSVARHSDTGRTGKSAK